MAFEHRTDTHNLVARTLLLMLHGSGLESWRSVSRRHRTDDESVYKQTLSPLDWLTQVWSQVLIEPFVSSMVHSTRSSGCKACQMG